MVGGVREEERVEDVIDVVFLLLWSSHVLLNSNPSIVAGTCHVIISTYNVGVFMPFNLQRISV